LRPDEIRAVTKRIFRDLVNDKRTLVVIFVTPIVTMTLYGVAIGNYVSDVPVVVVNKDEGYIHSPSNVTDNISNKIIANLNTTLLKVQYADNVSDAVDRVKRGEASAVIIFPKELSRNVYTWSGNQSSEGNTIKVMVDSSSVVVSDAVIYAVNNALLKTVQDAVKKVPINIAPGDPIYGEKIKPINLSFPGMITFSIFILITTLTTISVVEERASGTLSRILASPLKETELILGYAIPFSSIGILQAVLLLIVGILAFNITIVGSVIAVFVVASLLAIVSVSLGILLSSTARRLIHITVATPFIFLIVFLLSGIYFPLQQTPPPLRPLSYILPPTYAVDALRSVILKGGGLDMIWNDILALCAFAMIFLALAAWSLKMRKGK
jgi:ABC-2 type transport system permease protein